MPWAATVSTAAEFEPTSGARPPVHHVSCPSSLFAAALPTYNSHHSGSKPRELTMQELIHAIDLALADEWNQVHKIV